MRLTRQRLIGLGILMVMVIGTAIAAFAQDSSTYTVQSGDILDEIAARFDIQTSCLAKANELGNGSKIKPGQLLNLDFSCPRYDGLDFVINPREDAGSSNAAIAPSSDLGQGGGGPVAGPDDQSYTVARGDTLDTIGQDLDVSVVSLKLANDIGPRDKLAIGQTLIVPADAPAYGLFPAISNPLNPTSINTDLGQGGGGPSVGPNDQLYVIQQRDTLDGIGARFDTQTSCIAQNNSIVAANLIYPGQSIVISADCPRYDGFDVVTTPRGG